MEPIRQVSEGCFLYVNGKDIEKEEIARRLDKSMFSIQTFTNTAKLYNGVVDDIDEPEE